MLIMKLVKVERPMLFFDGVGAGAISTGHFARVAVVEEYFDTSLVPRLPTALLSVSIITIGALGVRRPYSGPSHADAS